MTTYKTLDDVPADTTIEMTTALVRLFKFAHCNPTCHACLIKITPGNKFKLASHKPSWADHYYDEMLCNTCTLDDYERLLEERHLASIAPSKGGYSRKSLEQRS